MQKDDTPPSLLKLVKRYFTASVTRMLALVANMTYCAPWLVVTAKIITCTNAAVNSKAQLLADSTTKTLDLGM